MRVNRREIHCLLLLCTLSFSCEKNDEIQLNEEGKASDTGIVEYQKDKNFLNLEDVRELVTGIDFDKHKSMGAKRQGNTLEEIAPLGPPDLPFAYVVNYKKGGWVMLAADKRINPVLAYSTETTFSLTEESYPGLLLDWLEDKASYIDYIRKTNTDAPDDFLGQWTKQNIEHTVTTIAPTDKDGTTYGDPANCAAQVNDPPAIIKTVGPLLDTRWGQGVGYNNSAPYLNCSNYSNGKAPTGCVATAIAQILRYHQYPNNYNWSIMPHQIYSSNSSSAGANEIARLMRDVGDAVDMDWGCDGSGANTKDDTPMAFKNSFNYSSANSADFNYDTVESELDNGRPVILSGGRAADYIFFDVYEDGHAWVCDGYRLNQKVVFTTYQGIMPPRYFCLTIASLHMNWGWNSGTLNGWYSYNNWEVGDYDFDYKRAMIYNIKK